MARRPHPVCATMWSALLSLLFLTSPPARAFTFNDTALPGQQILDYLHALGYVRNVTQPSPVLGCYIDYRSVNRAQPDQNVRDMADAGFNVIVLSVYVSSTGPADMMQAWASISHATQVAAVDYAHTKGAIVIMSTGGSTDNPYGQDPTQYGGVLANFAVQNGLDGVDLDLEGLGQGFSAWPLVGPTLIQWMVTLTTSVRATLGGARFVTHAPLPPYFGPIGNDSTGNGNTWPGPSGGYSAVYVGAASAINWMHMQFYNQGVACYVPYTSLFITSNVTGDCIGYQGTSVAEIAAYGVPLNKMVVGKPLETTDAGNGYVNASTLCTYFQQAATDLTWSTGAYIWSWQPTDAPVWAKTVFAKTCPPP